MAQKLNKCSRHCERQRSNLFLIVWSISVLLPFGAFSQEENPGVKPPKYKDYKNDTSYTNFGKFRDDVAKAQILALKNGALLVRLKTNANTIARLKAAGNMDLATQMERETALSNKVIIASYLKEFTFCPVYFFYSNVSDSVKKKKLDGILVDTTLAVNPAIVCNASFYLIAEGGQALNSSLGLVPEADAPKAIEAGTPSREVAIIIKNRYYIQLHKPFPYFQIKRSTKKPIVEPNGAGITVNLTELQMQLKKLMNNSTDAKLLIGLGGCVRALNQRFNDFYNLNKNYIVPAEIRQYVY